MSNSKIESLEPGRELDALVAERVFNELWPIVGGKFVWKTDRNNNLVFCGNNDNQWNFRINDILRPYSTSIAAAWEIVEKLRPKFYLSLEVYLDHVNACFCLHSEVFRSNGTHMYQGETIAAPHAICLAALKAVESQP